MEHDQAHEESPIPESSTAPIPIGGSLPLSDLATIMDRMWKQMVEFPMARMCKHHAAGIVIQEMEELGIEPPVEIIRAVVFCDDDVSLAWERGQPEDLAKTDDQDIGKEKA